MDNEALGIHLEHILKIDVNLSFFNDILDTWGSGCGSYDVKQGNYL